MRIGGWQVGDQFDQLLELRPDPARPLEAKLPERDVRAIAFATRARRYQRCPCPVIDPSDPAVTAWTRSATGPATPMSNPAEYFGRLYRWLHERSNTTARRRPAPGPGPGRAALGLERSVAAG